MKLRIDAEFYREQELTAVISSYIFYSAVLSRGEDFIE